MIIFDSINQRILPAIYLNLPHRTFENTPAALENNDFEFSNVCMEMKECRVESCDVQVHQNIKDTTNFDTSLSGCG